MQFLKRLSIFDLLAITISLLFTVAGILVSLHRFWQYDVYFYDFGIFDEAIWRTAHFQAPIIEHFVHEGQWIFGDHFNPTIFILSPLYWITDRSEVILIVQAAIFGISGSLLYFLSKKITNNSLYSIAILNCYFLFIGLQNAVITDFHEVSLTVLSFLLIYIAFEKKSSVLYWTSLLLMLGTKESNFTVGIAIGISLFLLQRYRWKISLATIVISFLYGIIATKLIIPYFSSSGYQYSVPLSFNPLVYAYALGDNPIKLHTIFFSFASFGFLPLFSPTFYILILEDFLTRFYPPYLTLSWSLGLHYSAVTAVIMGVSSIYGYRLLKRLIKPKKLIYIMCIVIICNALFLYRFVLRGPFALSYNPAFYRHTKDFIFLDKLISAVPKTGTVMTQNNLAVRFTHQNIYLFRDKCKTCKDYSYVSVKPKYIVLDARNGQNPNDFYGSGDLTKILKAILIDKNYKIVYHRGEQYIFERNRD